MALTRITKGVIKPNENYDTHNIVSTGIVTAVGLDINGNADISGNFSVGGVLTYEDVTSIDSVGIITARSGVITPYVDVDDFLDVGSNIKLGNAGVITATSFVGSGAALTGIDATAIKDSSGNVKVQAQASGAIHSGISTFNQIKLEDDKYLKLGTGNDFQLYHLASDNNSYIKETGSGSLMIQGDVVNIGSPTSGEYYIRAFENADVQIRYNNSTKIQTTNTGAVVTGILTATSFVGGLPITSGADNRVITASSASAIQGEANLTFDGTQLKIGGDSSVSGTFGLEIYNTDSNEGTALIAGTAGARLDIMDTGSSERLRIAAAGAAYFISYKSGDPFIFQTTDGSGTAERLRITSGGHISQGGGAEPSSSNGSVALKYGMKSNANNVIIGETTSSSNAVGLHIEARQNGRGSPRIAQIGLRNDASGNGQVTFYTSPSGADVIERMNITSTGRIEAKTNSIQFYNSGSNPSSPQNGDTYYNSTENALKSYVNGSWLVAAGEGNIVSSGSTAVYTVGGQKYLSHAITSSGIVTVTGNTVEVDYLIIAGGGGGGCLGGGGGAGGVLTGAGKQLNPGNYNVTIGAGGLNGGDAVPGATGGNTTAFGFTALGGGGGGSHDGGSTSVSGTNGGSGGGGSDNNNSFGPGSGTSGQGNNGGNGSPTYSNNYRGGGGGGGAGGVGLAYNVLDNGNRGNGGIGIQNAYETGSNNYYAGGGGKAAYAGASDNNAGDGGHGGGGGGSKSGGGSGGAGDAGLASANSRQGSAGSVGEDNAGGNGGANTGGGGGCNAWQGSGGASGGSGIIIIRYKISN